ncbi:MAG: hypothetical protein KJ826_02990 [Proteobacteria bacterium]|nr:hypothetical protein [Pseudomonadota bacterium]MBU4035234.1 hypothetical protein [Pseudomonadota bacterium]
MVINRTEEMDEQNKQMVRQIPNLPETGKIDAKARVVNEGGNLIFDIYHVKTSVKEESIDLSGKQQKEEAKEELTSEPEKKKDSSNLNGNQQKEEIKEDLNSDILDKNENLNIVREQSEEGTKQEIISDTQGKNKDNKIINDKQQKELASETTVTNIQKQGNAGSLELNE